MLLLIRPLEKRFPLERTQDPKSVRVDVIYTFIQSLGIFRLFYFLVFSAPLDMIGGFMRELGVPTFHLEQLIPALNDQPLMSFLVYLVVFDFFNYWIHRAQHQWPAWWALHALHHSQRNMTFWTDGRGHLLDDVILALLGSLISALIGVQPGQFVLLIVVSRLFESIQHANIDLRWWGVVEKLWVSPSFHRTHHSVGVGHEFNSGVLGGHNFGVLLPWWDVLFGTADFHHGYEPTGIKDQVLQGVSYGEGFWEQQWFGLKRLWVTLSGAK
jgi:sterol desaturase/sphingolipid hydroxylase (fatty acid hydroxylase superfamily)